MDLILYNPLSNNSKSNVQTHKLVRHYKKNKMPFRLKSILKIKDIQAYLEGKNHIDKIILLGGDGTINHFINNTINMNIKQDIYIKSNGTGNDFLRSLEKFDEHPQYIMKCTYDTGGSTHFINGTGMGIDGYVGLLIQNSKRKGKLAYLYNSVKAMFKYIPEPLTVNVDGEEHYFKKAYLITMNNGQYFGGGMKISPNATLNDDNLDVIVAHSVSKFVLLFIFFTIYLGKHLRFKKYVTHFRGKIIKATYTTPQMAQSDGENFYDVTSMEVTATAKTIHLRSYNKKR